MRPNPYGTLAVEDVRTAPAVAGPLDYSAHALVEHGGTPRALGGADMASRMGHGGILASAGLFGGHRVMLPSHGAARVAGADHLYGGLPKQVVWHKPG